MTSRAHHRLRAWRLEGDARRELELLPAPETNRGFREACAHRFAKPGPGWSLRIDDEPLPDADLGPDPAWGWAPRFFAGEVTAELIRPDGAVEALYLIDVSPDPTKLGRAIFSQMAEELWSEDPALVIGSEPATMAIGTMGVSEDPWLAFWRLRRYGPQVIAALRSVRAHPRRGLVPRRQLVPARRVRAIDRQTARAALRSPSALAFVAGGDEPSAVEIQLDCPRVEETLDTAANRCLLRVLRSMSQRARSLLRTLEQRVANEQESETRTELTGRWPARRQFLVDLVTRLRTELRRVPFSEVSRAEISAAGLNAIAADPSYARAYKLGWHALRGGVSGPPTDERLWISPSWEIYERWCFLALGRLLEASVSDLHWERRRSRTSWVLRGSSSAGDRTLSLSLQPVFRSETPAQGSGRWSVSRRRVPDIVLTERRNDAVRFWVFDAKYRTSRSNVLDAMTSAHVYQDSLRVGDLRPEATWLIVPSGGGARWLEDADFTRVHNVGVHVLAPDSDAALPAGLAEALHG